MDYADRLVSISDDTLTIRRYNLLLQTKRIPLEEIKAVERIGLNRLAGRARLWGAAAPSRWYNLDFGRPRKTVGFLIDDGDPLKSVVTPDHPEAFAAALRDHGIGGA